MNELERVASLVALLPRAGKDVVIGPGADDAAAWLEPDGSYMVATCDTSVEDVHFDLTRQEPQDVGWRALAFALGDLAAKGARPAYGLVSISLPSQWPGSLAEGIYRGLAELAREVRLDLVGGDTTSTPGAGSITITALGRTDVRPRARAEVQPGWQVAVTGPLGGASLGRARPRPLLERGIELAKRGLVCGDISDGLLREMDKVLAASGVGSALELARIPVSAGSTPLEALASGEEVELVCMGPPELLGGLEVVGTLAHDGRVTVVDEAGKEVDIHERGYDHFA